MTQWVSDSIVNASCEWRRGDSAVLLVAPHGGRRPPIDPQAPPPRLRVNDLYTPEVTRILAERLGAGVIINERLDRNVLDLNRTSQVRRRAPWFLDLLVQEIGSILERHAQAEVVFVHGWNTGQPKCDVGIGAIDTEDGFHISDGAQLTVSVGYLRNRIAALRAACARVEIRAAIGERYPASHPNNLVQLFASRLCEPDDASARIAAWADAGRLNAMQLELGIPLRWPGMWRDRFLGAVMQAFRSSPSDAPAGRSERRAQGSALGTAPAALQFYDAAADVGLFAGVGRAGARSWGGRLLLFLGGQRIALFTGEEVASDSSGAVPPLRFDTVGESMRLQFAGPMMALDDAAVYMDLEAALAASRLVEAEVAIEFRPSHASGAGTPARFGTVRGEVVIAGRAVQVHSGGFANAGAFRAAGSGAQTMIAAAFGTQCGLLSRVTGGDGLGLRFRGDAVTPLRRARIAVSNDGDAYTPVAFELVCEAEPPVHGRPLSRMTILRPAGGGDYLRVTFGTARFRRGDEDGYGLYEHAQPVSRRGA